MNETIDRLMRLADDYAKSYWERDSIEIEARAALRAELERLFAQSAEPADARDAARYRFLRDHAAYVGVNPHARTCLWVLRGIFELPGKGFDAAVDAQIAAAKESK